MKNRTAVFFALLVIVVAVASLPSLLRRHGEVRFHKATGTIRALNPADRTASLEVTDPDTGSTVVYQGKIPEGCSITIDGKQATFADIRVSDHAEVSVRATPSREMHRGKAPMLLVAESIRITRSGS